jgi:cell wall-associated NlpC family hydrolase
MRGKQEHTVTRLAGLLTILLLAVGCAGTPARDPRDQAAVEPAAVVPTANATAGTPVAPGDLRGPIANLALSLVGVPYRYGGANPDQGFDCSGLVYYTYRSNGQEVPRTSRQQFDAARKIPFEQAAAGDLIFFRGGEKLSHVGIYLGDGRFVHAPSTGGAVRVARIDAPYYQDHLLAVGRLLP